VSLRRCPACHNQVERDSETCPICGRTFAQAILSKAMRWTLLVALLAWSIHHFYLTHHV
jgi:predicted amidophosphoribosyltransferase